MLKNHLADQLLKKLSYQPTRGQRSLIDLLASYITDDTKNRVFIIKGYAGTGKTTIISTLVNVLDDIGKKFILMAPTGRAAKVLSAYSGKNAYTIHKRIYRQKSSKDTFGMFVLDKNLYSNTIFIVDEASMISDVGGDHALFGTGNLLDDLIQYVKNDKNCSLILIGDIAQLPPVGANISPALNKASLQRYFNEVIEYELTDVVRQSENSGILVNATLIRHNITNNIMKVPKFIIHKFHDIQIITGNELQDTISMAYDRDGIENTIVICRSNKTANKYNTGIRKNILWREDELSSGDLLMIVKNNYYWFNESEKIDFIANGDIAKVLKIRKNEEIYGFHFADVLLELVDYDLKIETKIMLDTLTVNAPALGNEDNRKLFYTIMEDYKDIVPVKRQYEKVKSNSYFNALQVKFAYAVTCHKAQGGQWKNVFIDIGYFTAEKTDIEFLRWLYTAFTRATEKLYLVNFPEELLKK
jgi:exodeoxyribonuclease-5